MSEIRTISDGSFVLGQTSATNFEAGPGISITQPSEGTIRIANDETVLWSGDLTTSSFSLTLNETCQNFEIIRFEGYSNNGVGWPMYGYTYTNNTRDGGKIECSLICAEPQHFKATVMELSGTSLKCIDMFEKNFLSTGVGYLQNNYGITKVVGVNRIAGGN